MAVADVPAPPRVVDENYKFPYRFEIVPLDDLKVDSSYQRPLTNFWKTVVEKFNPALVGTLIVSERRNGTKHIIDGQTRWTAMVELGHPGAPCLIYEGLSKHEEARLFADLQTQRRGMRSYDRFRAQLVAKEPLALGIAKVVSDAGFELSLNETPNTLRAIASLEQLYKVDDTGEHLTTILTIVKNVWGVDDKDAVSAQILRGLSTFLNGQERVDINRLERRLRDVTPKWIMNKAASIREGASAGSGRAPSVAQAILNLYIARR